MSDDKRPVDEGFEDEGARLDRLGRLQTPAVDHAYADRLEADLRVQHAQLGSRRTRVWGMSIPQILAGAAVLLVALIGVVGLSARSMPDEGVLLDVSAQPAGEPSAPPELPNASGKTENAPTPGDVRPEATTTAPAPTSAPVPTAAPVIEPTSTSLPADPVEPTPSARVDPAPATPTPASPTVMPLPTPTALAPPTPTPALTPTPTPTPALTPTPTPTATATAVPGGVEATPIPLATETPAPTSTPVAPAIVATCESRTTGDVVGVVCEWNELVGIDLSGFRVMRTRNGGARELVAEVAPQETMAVDRLVRPGDTITYRVLALTGDVVRSESAAIEVMIPS